MTAKDKAIELVGKYCGNDCTHKNVNKSKKYALICVDEILSFIEDADPQALSYELIGYRDYWSEVLTEIESL